MAYLLYTLIFFTLIFGTSLYLTRGRWLPQFQDVFFSSIERLPPWFPGSGYIYSRLPSVSNSFSGDMEAGLSSSTFDLSQNVEGSDSRAGLDDAAKREILKLMQRRRLKFDEARRVYMEQRFQANGIGADGRPRDPKFVSFS
ncbi:hypothetical protein B0H66DRAFT_522685 [Apodospora peruviana]|uniref:Uncharacterized protein n=1 Tax=Apodospora peruviana TaxID=516989 RepID=A0AAE0LZK6_9PEZI|nr:hypothetical protein B0H66DRAFT_522685 [Apodospora peruviana]